jgi:predicted nucleotidyltransferase
MDRYKLKFTRLQNEIFRLLSVKAGERLNQREIAKLLKVSATAVGNALVGIEKEGLVKVDRNRAINFHLVGLDRDNQKAVSLKRIENLKMVTESGLVGILEDKFPSCVIILFGSYSFGEDVIGSDIDIAIIGTKGKSIDVSKYDKLLEREININFYKDTNSIDKNLKMNILNGIVLSGRL